MLAERQRKADEHARQLAEDAAYANQATKRNEDDRVREETVKREMSEHYRRLTVEAEQREERAKWRRKRMDLRGKRITFWRKENRLVMQIVYSSFCSVFPVLQNVCLSYLAALPDDFFLIRQI
jgi:prophage tail gpP-like protein